MRHTGHGLDGEHCRDVFWDATLNHPDEVSRSPATSHGDRTTVSTDGSRPVRCRGTGALALPFRYLGADDGAGPNSTGQSVVDSHYEWVGGAG